MKFFILITILTALFSGCSDTKHHLSFSRDGNITILDLNKTIMMMKGREINLSLSGIEIMQDELNKNLSEVYRIAIPITFTTTKSYNNYAISPYIDFCTNGYPTNENGDLYVSNIVNEKYIQNKFKALILTSPDELIKKGFIDDNNNIKKDICIYPMENIIYNTMQDEDAVKITTDELNQAITEYERIKIQ